MQRGTKAIAASAVGMTLAVVLVLAGPAWAKGLQSATITGPGLEQPIDVADPDNSKLPALTGFWEVMPGQPAPPGLVEQAPTKQRGPRYRLTWRLMTDADDTIAIRQDLYPHAVGGPLVHTAAGQPIFDAATPGGWYAAPLTLRDMLQSLGVPPAGSPPAPAAPSSDDSPGRIAIVVAATAVVALAGGGGAFAVHRARRRERVAPVPL
jgi:hypothetical protein